MKIQLRTQTISVTLKDLREAWKSIRRTEPVEIINIKRNYVIVVEKDEYKDIDPEVLMNGILDGMENIYVYQS